MKIQDVVKCSFNKWYTVFMELTPRSIMVPLPEGFVEYLLADGVVLPKSLCQDNSSHCAGSYSDDDDHDDNWDSSDSDADTPKAPCFEDFDKEIKSAIVNLGGKVFPKLNWSSPRDAAWILNNSCCCTSVADIYLLLKSSDFILHDITQPVSLCVDYDPKHPDAELPPFYLVLREWVEINPDTEFRCFVKDGRLIAITQRDASMYSEYNVTHKEEIVFDICAFFFEHIQNYFCDESCIFDVVRKGKDNIFLLDLNPFGEVTDSVFFDWSELTSGELCEKTALPEYRCLSFNRGIQPHPFSYYAVPKDIIDIASGEDTQKFFDLLKLKAEEQNDSSSEEH